MHMHMHTLLNYLRNDIILEGELFSHHCKYECMKENNFSTHLKIGTDEVKPIR